MHKRNPPELSPLTHGRSHLQTVNPLHSGFSLVEVAMSIAIIGFAFVALIGMLPSGMTVFRGSIDTANENWILQDINAMLQTTAWSKVQDMDSERGGDIFVYDEEGKLIDRVELSEVDGKSSETKAAWQYVVKLIVEEAEIGDGGSRRKLSSDSKLVTVVISHYSRAKSLEEFRKITKAKDATEEGFKKNSGLVTRSFILTRLDSAFD